MILQIPEVFSSGTQANLHSPAHIAILQHRLAEAFGHRYNHFYNSQDIDERIGLCRDALIFLSEHSDHISPVPVMASLGTALYIRFTVLAQQNDLYEGFKLLSSAVHMCPLEPHYLADLGSLLVHIYTVSGSIDHLDESLSLLRRAHGLRIGHPARGKICRAIAAAMITEDQHFGERIDFCWDVASKHYKEVLLWQPLGHHSHFEGWDGLCIVFSMQFDRTSNMHFLNRAIHSGQMAYTMLNSRHPRAFRYSANLSNAFWSRFEALGSPADLERALFYAKHSLHLAPPDRRPKKLRDLANIMTSAAEYSGDVEVLSESVSLAREALGCVHESEKYLVLETLGESLIVKASHFGDIEDLKEGIHHMRQMLECVDKETFHYTDGAVYASKALLQYYEMNPSQHFHALTEATDLLEGVRSGNVPEAYIARVLHCTAKAYRAQFYHSGILDVMKSAFEIDHQVLNLRPPGHPRRFMSLAAISDDIVGLSGIAEFIDLENSISMLKDAQNDLVDGHPDLLKVSVSLAKLLLISDTGVRPPPGQAPIRAILLI
jgi:hypothetical protein